MNVLEMRSVGKTFIQSALGGVAFPILKGVSLDIQSGEIVALEGPSGSGKSSLLKMTYGKYLCTEGCIRLRQEDEWREVSSASPRDLLVIRRDVLAYVSQFLRVIPRVPAIDVVAAPLLARGMSVEASKRNARELMDRLGLPERLWALSPTTFSGGEKQRVNIARAFVAEYPLMLLDEPTASLDEGNRRTMIELVHEARHRGTTIVGIFHDVETRSIICDRTIDLTEYTVPPS